MASVAIEFFAAHVASVVGHAGHCIARTVPKGLFAESLVGIALVPVSHDVVLDVLRSLVTLHIGEFGSDGVGATIHDVAEVRERQSLEVVDGHLGELHRHIVVDGRNIHLAGSLSIHAIVLVRIILGIIALIEFGRVGAVPVGIIVPVGVHAVVGGRMPSNILRHDFQLEIRLARTVGGTFARSPLLEDESKLILIALVEVLQHTLVKLDVERSLRAASDGSEFLAPQRSHRRLQKNIFPQWVVGSSHIHIFSITTCRIGIVQECKRRANSRSIAIRSAMQRNLQISTVVFQCLDL